MQTQARIHTSAGPLDPPSEHIFTNDAITLSQTILNGLDHNPPSRNLASAGITDEDPALTVHQQDRRQFSDLDDPISEASCSNDDNNDDDGTRNKNDQARLPHRDGFEKETLSEGTWMREYGGEYLGFYPRKDNSTAGGGGDARVAGGKMSEWKGSWTGSEEQEVDVIDDGESDPDNCELHPNQQPPTQTPITDMSAHNHPLSPSPFTSSTPPATDEDRTLHFLDHCIALTDSLLAEATMALHSTVSVEEISRLGIDDEDPSPGAAGEMEVDGGMGREGERVRVGGWWKFKGEEGGWREVREFVL